MEVILYLYILLILIFQSVASIYCICIGIYYRSDTNWIQCVAHVLFLSMISAFPIYILYTDQLSTILEKILG